MADTAGLALAGTPRSRCSFRATSRPPRRKRRRRTARGTLDRCNSPWSSRCRNRCRSNRRRCTLPALRGARRSRGRRGPMSQERRRPRTVHCRACRSTPRPCRTRSHSRFRARIRRRARGGTLQTRSAAAPIATAHVPVPEQSPDQPANAEPGAGDAVRVTTVSTGSLRSTWLRSRCPPGPTSRFRFQPQWSRPSGSAPSSAARRCDRRQPRSP